MLFEVIAVPPYQDIISNPVLKHHQTVIANVLLTDHNQQVVVVMDGTYLYIQKSSHNELQRRTYSMHKHRHLIKAMVITTTVRTPFFRIESLTRIFFLRRMVIF